MLTLAFNIQLVKSEPRTWTVDDDGPADFSTIQGAIYAASPGDTIYVKAGTYREPQVTINKPLQLIGENKNTTIVDGNGTWVCLYVQNTQNVTISGFTVQNGFGLYSWGSQNVTINENIILDNGQGIVIGESTYITVSKNIVTQNVVMPILLDGSNNSKIYENIFTLNNEDSIWLGDSSNNSIYGNKIKSNGRGIRLDWSSNNKIYGNDITNNGVGIYYWASSNNSIYGNKIEDNVSGIVLKGYSGNLSSSNTFYRNNITNNEIGVNVEDSSNNIFYHNNFIDNTHQVNIETSGYSNSWDDGYGGNYWSDYGERYPDAEELNGSGIWDTPYVIDENNQDNYPLMNPWAPSVEPRTWTVDDDTPADFSLIQEAINAASPGDIIFVYSGTYYENVVVNKTVSLVGENRSTTVIDAKGKGTVVVVTAEAANIQNFTVQNSGIRPVDSGIVLSKSMSNIVEGNIISNNGFGIGIALSNNNTIYHNVLVNNWVGMRFYSSRLNIVSGNVITNNHDGIKLYDSGDNVLRNNSMVENVYNFGVSGDELPHFINDVDASNTVDGKAIYYLINKQHLVVEPSAFPDAGYLAVINSTRITVQDFCFFNNFQGVLFAYTNNSKIENVNISDNFHGIMLFGSNNTLKGNNLTKNGYAIHSYGHSSRYFENVIADNNDGIWLIGSNNSIRRNAITNNNYRGIYLVGSNNTVFQNEIMNNSVGIVIDFYDNKIYHNNFINNVKQSDLNEPRAIGIWDGGYPSGGNYWSDYSGIDLYSGPYQNETGSDGIGDTPYFIDENNQDNYPLMKPWSPKPPSPVEATKELIETIETWNLSKGIENSLTAKLDNVIHQLNKGNENVAINKLTALINQVDALRGKKLTTEQANYLISEAQRIIDLING